MISLEKCDEILNRKERKYTKEQVVKIRDFLIQIASIINESNQLKNEKSGGEKSDFI